MDTADERDNTMSFSVQTARGGRGVMGTVPDMSDEAAPVAEGTTTIVIADDHAVMRSGLKMLLEAEEELEVVAEAGDVEETIRKLKAYKPDVLLLDLHMPGGPSLQFIPEMREASAGTRIVVLTMQNSPGYVREALRAGAIGYVTKEAADDELVEAVRLAAKDEPYLHPRLGARLATEPVEE